MNKERMIKQLLRQLTGKDKLRLLLLGVAWAILLSRLAAAQAPEDFGYNRIEARGPRPLLVVLTQFDTYPALRNNATAYFNDVIFNTFRADANGRALPNLSAYFIENSNGRFFWTRGGQGVVGPYKFSKNDVGTDNGGKYSRVKIVLEAVAKDGFDFAQYDENGDGQVTTNELTVLIVENLTTTGAANRASDPTCFRPEGSPVTLCLRAALVGDNASLMSMAHELMHSLGIGPRGDLYGSNDNSQGYTTMGATIYQELDDMRTFHLDPFHKLQLGWVEPKLRSLSVPGGELIGVASMVGGDEPVILYDPARGTNEFFILEYRSNATPLGRGYEADLPSDGLAIWQVKTDDNKEPALVPSLVNQFLDPAVFLLGAPNMARGRGSLWAPSDLLILGQYNLIPYPLRWLDTVSTDVKIRVGRTQDSGKKLSVSWGSFNEPLPVYQKILYYNNSSNLAAVGRIEDNDDHTTLNSFYPGYNNWTSVVEMGSEIFYYNAETTAAMVGRVDAAGNHTTVLNFPQRYFGAGWTHIVWHRGYLFFYCDKNGMAAIGQITSNGFHQYQGYPAYSFGVGWSQIVSTQNGLLFYRGTDGAGAVGDWEFSYYPCQEFCFPTISEVRFKQLSSYGAGSFTYGWSSIVETANGVLFYRKSDGLQVMVDVNRNGQIVTRSHTVRHLKPGYTGIVAVGDDILLYNAQTGDAAVAGIIKPRPWLAADAVGGLSIRREFPGSFSTGWSHLTTVTDPTVVR